MFKGLDSKENYWIGIMRAGKLYLFFLRGDEKNLIQRAHSSS